MSPNVCQTGEVQCLQALFELQVKRAPDRIAVSYEGAALTYGELDARANRLAHRLRQLGVGPNVLVAVLLDRSLELVVAIIAALKAGAAYLPLDPANPPERLRYYLDDARAPVLITQSHLGLSVPAHVQRIAVDTTELSTFPACRPSSSTQPADLAYIIYTSGSTGTPKGVEITHANLIRLFSATRPLFGFGDQDVWSLAHSPAFDFSVWEIFGALLHGGRLVILPLEVVRQPRRLATCLSDERVSVLSQTPSAFRQLSPALLELNAPLALRFICFGGEALDFTALCPWVARFGDVHPQLINMYGITETTVHVTVRRVTATDTASPKGYCIGTPIPDLQVHLLDEQFRAVADGTVGEICVSGAGLARGYLNRPELTEQKFPFVQSLGERVYRSGDLARRLSNGELLYLGRADEQIKLRGYRIEPAEIVAQLLDTVAVADASVRCNGEGEHRYLTAYVVPKASASLSVQGLRAALSQRLPDYMIPTSFVFLERLPLTLNGKLDRAALPQPLPEPRPYQAPVTACELALAGQIKQALGDRLPGTVGLSDRFVTLGGNSLCAAQVVSGIEEELGVSLLVSDLLSDLTVAELAQKITALRGTITTSKSSQAPPTVLPPPPSAMQRDLWLHAQLHPESPAYNETLTLFTKSAVDADWLKRCLAEIVVRHPALRTRFEWCDGMLKQHIEPPFAIEVAVGDLRKLNQEERQSAARRLAETQASAPFDLSLVPRLRVQLLYLEEQACQINITSHHINCDARSQYLLAKELAEQNSLQAQERRPRRRESLLPSSEASSKTALPYTATRHSLFVPPSLALGLHAVGSARGATLFMVLLAAWKSLLFRYIGSDELDVGIPLEQRGHAQNGQCIGLFLRMLEIRTGLHGDMSYAALLEQIRATFLSVIGASTSPGVQQSSRPLKLVFTMLPPAPTLPHGWKASVQEVQNGAAKYDLLLLLQEGPSGELCGFIESRSSLHDHDAVTRLTQHFLNLLKGVAADAQRNLSQLPLLSIAERSQLLAWGQGPKATLSGKCVHDLFLTQAAKTPEAIAVESESVSLTYRQFAERAAAIAAQLRSIGVGPEVRVAVYLERTVDLIVATLGILIAGGAFVPLDPENPPARLASILDDAQPAATLSWGRLCKRLPNRAGTVIDLEQQSTSASPSLAPLPRVELDHLAYVIFTSGSTGRPKGVMIEHRSLTNYAEQIMRSQMIEPGRRVLQFARLSFDAAIWEIFPTLLTGSTLCIPGPRHPPLGLDLLAALHKWSIDTLQVPPSVLAAMPSAPLQQLKTLVVGGEACAAEVVDRWAPGRRFINAYGPTEATVFTTCASCAAGQGKPALGRPLGNVEVYVLDGRQQPVPIGVPGELYIGGLGLARGYLNQPDLTRERFIENPLRPGIGQRLYRTGDRARWRADGQLDFLGRLDEQIKLRGSRIEPEEIAGTLLQHPAVQSAVVVPREDLPGHLMLCAYVVLSSSPACSMASLKQHVRDRLPEYMVPAHVVFIDALPLTPNGKIDRRALPPPQLGDDKSATNMIQKDSLEGRVAETWCDVLGVTSVSLDDNFFDLGGNSILLATVQARLSEVLGKAPSMMDLFQHPTVSVLAEHLRGKQETSASVNASHRATKQHLAFAAAGRRGGPRHG